MRRLALSTGGKSYRRSLTARERHQNILTGLDTLTQAIAQALQMNNDLAIDEELKCTRTLVLAAQKHMEEIT